MLAFSKIEQDLEKRKNKSLCQYLPGDLPLRNRSAVTNKVVKLLLKLLIK